jgi:hypothetical protein
LPDPVVARKAVESTLEAWHQSPQLVTTAYRLPSIVFVDQQRRPGQPLVSFAVLSESESEGYRRFQVKLSLAEPEESRLVAYYVFGEDPVWVYRSEDFEMIMHWDCPPPPETPAASNPPVPEERLTPRT